jgi:hypothetical protein
LLIYTVTLNYRYAQKTQTTRHEPRARRVIERRKEREAFRDHDDDASSSLVSFFPLSFFHRRAKKKKQKNFSALFNTFTGGGGERLHLDIQKSAVREQKRKRLPGVPERGKRDALFEIERSIERSRDGHEVWSALEKPSV